MLHYVVALPAEARPLIAHYGLARDPRGDLAAGAFKVFRGDGVALVVSAPGKVASAAATAYLHLATGGAAGAAWINVGIAGHGAREVGEAIVAHKIRDQASGESWYPARLHGPRLAGDEVVTVDVVERRFRTAAAYDMEASGFYPTACRFSPPELVQCFKVVSDTPGAAPERLTARRVERLIGDRLEEVVALAEATLRAAWAGDRG